MTLSTLPRYLLGRRSAILEVIESRGVLLLGFLFVLSAGFAREYDGEDLVAEPWHVLIPLVASVGSCALLYGLLLIVARPHSDTPLAPRERFPRFLGLYWMTAPLAWLYAIPVERWLEPVDAMAFNLSLLGIVALWRVVLISRAAAVLFGTRFWKTFFPVMLFGDALMLVIVTFTPMPIFQIMGGVRLTPTESLLQGVQLFSQFFGVVLLPVWMLVTAIAFWRSRKEERRWQPLPLAPRYGGVSGSLWGLAIVSLLVWIPLLPSTQPPLRLRHKVDSLLAKGDVEQAVQLMSAHERSDFPPIWDPAPRAAYDEFLPPLHEVLRATRAPGTAPWVRELYVDKLARRYGYSYGPPLWGHFDDAEFEEYTAAIGELPRDSRLVESTIFSWRDLLGAADLSDGRREFIVKTLEAWGADPTPLPSSSELQEQNTENSHSGPDGPSRSQADTAE